MLQVGLLGLEYSIGVAQHEFPSVHYLDLVDNRIVWDIQGIKLYWKVFIVFKKVLKSIPPAVTFLKEFRMRESSGDEYSLDRYQDLACMRLTLYG